MAQSMTGYGQAERIVDNCRFHVEIKSVNNRYMDVQIRSPRSFLFLEHQIKEKVSQYLTRGKVDIFITLDDKREDGAEAALHTGLAQAYSQALSEIAGITGRPDTAGSDVIARFPDVIVPRIAKWPEGALEKNFFPVLEEALSDIKKMREKEGERLAADLKEKIQGLVSLHEKVQARAPVVPEEYKKRLRDRMQELTESIQGVEIDEGRKEMELSIFADKCCIDEELVRLSSHFKQLISTLDSKDSIGKKLDFLLQETNREVNTIGSKGNDMILSGLVVEMKAELEKVREQIQNLV